VIGAALFLFFHWAGGGEGDRRIVVTRGQIDHLSESFNVVWLRPPTDEELKGLLDDYVREEVAIREATRMGLDRDDSVIRRRLRQKFEFMVEDSLETHPPTDEDLMLWLEKHSESFRSEPRISFRQVYVSPERRGTKAEELASRYLADLTAAGADASIESLGDPLMLPQEVPLSSRSDVARSFGEDFAARALTLEPGRWQGPVESGFGLHLVFVRERVEGRLAPLSEIRDAVERDFQAARSQAELEATYERLLSGYTVVVEKEASTIQ
jgi:parvulin-like peptidyl-prolyl isomerase